MASPEQSIRIYQDLAAFHDRQGEDQVRDRYLVLAADAAQSAGHIEEAESLRGQLLRLNPHHLLKPFASLGQAMQSPDVRSYLEGLRRAYPRDGAEQLLEKMRSSRKEPEVSPAAADRPELASTIPAAKMEASDSRQTSLAPSSKAREAESPALRPAEPAPTPPKPSEAAIPFAKEKDSSPNEQASPDLHSQRRQDSRRKSSSSDPLHSEQYEDEDEETGSGAWVATLLFMIVLLTGLSLAVYTFARPFLSW